MSNFDPTAQLVILRDMTQRMGILHEAQALQLRLCPYSVDPELTRSDAQVDLDNKKVTFLWTRPAKKASHVARGYRKRLEALVQHIKFLFGDEWHTEIITNGVTILNSALGPTNGRKSKKTRRVRS